MKTVKDTVSKLKIFNWKELASLGPHRRQRQADLLISRPIWSTQGVQTRQAFIAQTVNLNFGNSFDLLVFGSEVDFLDGNGVNI